jgi:hypothetical protein
MTKDEILAALENARMDLERAIATIKGLPEPYCHAASLEMGRTHLKTRITELRWNANERG